MQADSQLHGFSLEALNVSRQFGDVLAVNDVSLRIPAGQTLVVLGTSGSGKSTLLRIIAGFEPIGRGRLRIGDEDVGELPPHRRDMGVVFQHQALFPHMTVAENVEYPLRMRNVSRELSKQRVSQMLHTTGLAAFADRYPRELSGGEQQRVALARAVVFKPRVLLMDEPLTALDKLSREQLQREIRALQKAMKITTLYVTHDQSEAFVLADLVAVMNNGRIEQTASPREIYEAPHTEFVARFVGDSNIFKGKVISIDAVESTIQLDDGVSVRCSSRLIPNSSATLLVRPEKMTLGSASSGNSNFLSAKITEIRFLGEFIEYRLRANNHELIARRQNNLNSTRSAVGDEVLLSWPIVDTVVLP